MKGHDLRDPFLIDRKLVPKSTQKPLFLLSLATVASLTSIQAQAGQQDSGRVAVGTMPTTTTN